MSTTNNFIFNVLRIIVWLIFIGLCIEAGGMLVNFFFSLYNPGFVKNLYQKPDLSKLYVRNRSAFYGAYSFILIISVLKAYMFFIVLMLVHKMNLTKPFNDFVSRKVSKISYLTLSIGLISAIAREFADNVTNHGYDIRFLNQLWGDSQAYIFMGAVIYIIAIIFQKGVELQTENELTV